jgi:VCBS repeat-containing protein
VTVQSDRNHKPQAKNDRYWVDEDEVLEVSAPGVIGNDRDRDGDSLFATLVAGPRHGTLVFNADGSFVYTPDANFHGKDFFTYRVSDGEAESGVAKVTIMVKSVNDAPVLAPIEDRTVEAGTLLEFTTTATDVDGPKNKLKFSLSDGAPAGATINAKTGEFKWTPTAQQAPGVYEITVTVTDGTATDSQAFTVTVTEQIVRDTLIIKGTTGCDVIKVCEEDGGLLKVSVNGATSTYKLLDGTTVEVQGGDGNDAITLKGFNRDATVYGGNGNDFISARGVTNGSVRLFGENGCDVLIGGCGDDLLDGGNARDLLIGGDGDDFLKGGHGKDVTIQDRSYWDKLKTCLSNRDWVKEFLDCRLT